MADDGSVVSAGGRVLSVVATGADLAQARERAYALVESGPPARLAPPHRHRAGRCRGSGAACPAPPDPADARAEPHQRRHQRRPGPSGPLAAVAGSAVLRHAGARRRRPPAARAGHVVFDLAAGQPSTAAPAPVLAAAHAALDCAHPRLHRDARVSRRCARPSPGTTGDRYDLDVDADNVVVTTGSSGGFLLAFLAAFDVGSRVGLARPGYPAYRNILHALGCEVVDLPCGPETRYQPTVPMVDGPRPGRPDRGQPGQPDRHHAGTGRTGRAGDPMCRQPASG